MVESSSPQAKVRELRVAPRYIPVEIDGAVSYEVILTMWTNLEEKDHHSSFELGEEWHQRLGAQISNELLEEIQQLGGPYYTIWLSLLGLIASAPHPHDPPRVFEWLGGINPQRLRRWILGYLGQSADSALVEEGANGSLEAVRQVVQADHNDEITEHIVTLFAMDPIEMRDRLVATASRFRDEVFAQHEEDFAGAISRAAAAQRAATGRDNVKKVIEDATKGLDYEVPPGVRRVILIPSVVIRPLSIIDQQRDTLLVMYGVADEFIDSDPEAPPSWLVRTYKALSDERRLRILRRLSEGETSLDELTEMLGLSKSTVHHHISVLRAAGLVRVQISSEEGTTKHDKTNRYSLRPQALHTAGDFLDTYIRSNQQLTNHAGHGDPNDSNQ